MVVFVCDVVAAWPSTWEQEYCQLWKKFWFKHLAARGLIDESRKRMNGRKLGEKRVNFSLAALCWGMPVVYPVQMYKGCLAQ